VAWNRRVAPKLKTGAPMISETIPAGSLFEAAYAAELGDLAAANPELSIGSYPAFRDGGFHNEIVVRGRDAAKVAAAAAAIGAMVARLGKERPESRCREHPSKRMPFAVKAFHVSWGRFHRAPWGALAWRFPRPDVFPGMVAIEVAWCLPPSSRAPPRP